MADWKHDYAKLNAVTLHYVSAGAGDPVVLLQPAERTRSLLADGPEKPRNSDVSGGGLCTSGRPRSSKSLSDAQLSLRLFTDPIR